MSSVGTRGATINTTFSQLFRGEGGGGDTGDRSGNTVRGKLSGILFVYCAVFIKIETFICT